jgi:hypothetical protein
VTLRQTLSFVLATVLGVGGGIAIGRELAAAVL